MAYLIIATSTLTLLGYQQFITCIGITFIDWEYNVPEIMFGMIYILSAVLFLAVGVMFTYHLSLIACGETSVEAQDNEVYIRHAKERNEKFVNSYDCGKWKNLQFFFNIGEGGYSRLTLFLPLRLDPYTDGFSWARKDGYEKHLGVLKGEELTDEEDEDDS
jgi:palmitoyltransferase